MDKIISILREELTALFDYSSTTKKGLSFKKGDTFYLLENNHYDWWYVYHPVQDKEGYVPAKFMATRYCLDNVKWFCPNMSRHEAERLLQDSLYPPGSFLIRPSETSSNIALTIKDALPNIIRHYLIHCEEGSIFILNRQFKSMDELIQHYSLSRDSLCHRLTYIVQGNRSIIPSTVIVDDQYEIDRSTLTKKRKLGEGYFAEVWHATWQERIEVAVKSMKTGKMSAQEFLKEAQIMKTFDHPHLVRLYAVCTKEEPLYIITELMCNGSLHQFFRTQRESVTVDTLVNISAQIASGMKYLESKQYVHRDLAGRNILVGDTLTVIPVVKIADFGLSRLIAGKNAYTASEDSKFPVKWTAPEGFYEGGGTFTPKSDVWSFGVLLYEIFTKGKTPYAGLSNKDILEFITNGHRMLPVPDIPAQIYEIMLRCWRFRPQDRPTFDYLQSYFDNFDVTAALELCSITRDSDTSDPLSCS